MARYAQGSRASEKLLSYGPPAPWLRIVYNCLHDTKLGGRTLIDTGPDVYVRGLRIEWRDFPYRGEESVNAAIAARAARAQGKYWEYHDLLYREQASGYSDETLMALVRRAGLDIRQFESDYSSGR